MFADNAARNLRKALPPSRAKDRAPLTYFDELVLAQLDAHWRKAARIVGQTMVAAFNRGDDVGIPVTLGRLRILAAAGQMETAGNLARMGYSEVRLPPSEREASV
jgi:hypothetical protein